MVLPFSEGLLILPDAPQQLRKCPEADHFAVVRICFLCSSDPIPSRFESNNNCTHGI